MNFPITLPSHIPKLIAICGYKRSGKDTVAKFFSDTTGHSHIKIAAKLKQVVRTLFDFSEEQVESDLKETIDDRWGVTPRNVMQFMGTEMFQYKLQEMMPDIERRFWIMNLINDHRAQIEQGHPMVISDLRFMHEYLELKKYGVYIIRVNKNNMITADQHPSEVEFMDIPVDLELHNDGTIQDLYKQVTNTFNINQTV